MVDVSTHAANQTGGLSEFPDMRSRKSREAVLKRCALERAPPNSRLLWVTTCVGLARVRGPKEAR